MNRQSLIEAVRQAFDPVIVLYPDTPRFPLADRVEAVPVDALATSGILAS